MNRWESFINAVKQKNDTFEAAVALVTFDKTVESLVEWQLKSLLGSAYESVKNLNLSKYVFENIINDFFNDSNYSIDHRFIDIVIVTNKYYGSAKQRSIVQLLNNLCNVAFKRLSKFNIALQQRYNTLDYAYNNAYNNTYFNLNPLPTVATDKVITPSPNDVSMIYDIYFKPFALITE